MICYVKNLFSDVICVVASTVWGCISAFLFPETAVLTAAGAVLGIMVLDLLTKMFALARTNGGLRKAVKKKIINSHRFGKGTLDKLIVFGVMLIVGGFAYRISPVAAVATGFMQTVFSLMFLRDVLSIIENLTDSGISGLGPLKKIFKKKYDELCDNNSSSDDNNNGGIV